MSTQKYPAPPIIDSVIELRFENPLSKRAFEQIARKIAPEYDFHEIGEEAEVEVRVESGGVTPRLKNPRAVHTFSGQDQTDRLRFDPFKIFWGCLPPYEGWEPFEARVFRDLERFPRKVGLPAIQRIGVRFRNRLDVPVKDSGVASYEDYIGVNIELPAIFDPHDGYVWKVVKHFRDRGLSATVASGIIEPEVPKTVAILLDIDVYKEMDLPSSLDDLKQTLTSLRELKNEIFEVCVTDKARESFR